MDSISTSYFEPGNQARVSSGEPFNSNENALVNGFPALIKFSLGLINRSTITMNEKEFIIIQINCLPGLVCTTSECKSYEPRPHLAHSPSLPPLSVPSPLPPAPHPMPEAGKRSSASWFRNPHSLPRCPASPCTSVVAGTAASIQSSFLRANLLLVISLDLDCCSRGTGLHLHRRFLHSKLNKFVL